MLTNFQLAHPTVGRGHRNAVGGASVPELDQLDKEIANALQIILAKYGHNLPQYFRDVEKKESDLSDEPSKDEEAIAAREILQKIHAQW